MKQLIQRYPSRYDDLRPGDVISIRFAGVLSHYGVVTHAGTVLTNSRRHGGVIEQSIATFEDGRILRRHGPLGSRHPLEVEARARRTLGADYDLTSSNCVHYVRRAHGKRPTSVQAGAAVLRALGDMAFGSRRR